MKQKLVFRFTPKTEKEFSKLSVQIRDLILNKLLFFQSLENPLYYAKVLKNSELGEHRFRVGDYRVVCVIEKEFLVISRIAHRREVYK